MNTEPEFTLVDLQQEGLVITGLECEKVKVIEYVGEKPVTKNKDYIRVMVKDSSLSELQGGYITYRIETSGGFGLVEVDRKIGGYCDKVISIANKDC